MLFFQLKLSAHHLPINCVTNSLVAPLSGYAVECIKVRPSTALSISGVSLMKNVSTLTTLVSSCVGPQCSTVLPASAGTGDTSCNVEFHVGEGHAHLLLKPSLTGDTQGDDYSSLATSCDFENDREVERRRKIGLANRGKVPWNKGRKHCSETRERIRQRTREAMSDPKVRKKMSECPRSLSNKTKARIGTSLRKVWGHRLKWKRSREKFWQLWAESIANAAKKGGGDQKELEWDSYEKLEREIALQELEWAKQKAKQKEMARIRAERAAKERAERKERLAQKKKEQEERAKVRGESKTKSRRSKQEKEVLAATQELKLKTRLIKIHRKKSIVSQISSQQQRAWENLDVELTKLEPIPQVTLADQIHHAKVKRSKYVTHEILTGTG